jgi:hypothetical protein
MDSDIHNFRLGPRSRARPLSLLASAAIVILSFIIPTCSMALGGKREGHASSKVPVEPVKLTPSVSFSEQSVGEGDSLYVETWFSNDTDTDLSQVSLEIFSPNFLEWHEKSCSDPIITGPFLLESPARHTLVEHKLCARLKQHDDVKVGDFNILFIYRYQWRDGKTNRESVASVEKPLKIVLLGSDNILGVPLGLAALIVPGLFFWFAISLWKAPWRVGLALGENLFYSLIVSAIFFAIGYFLPPTWWFSRMEALKGISLGKLVSLALTGVIVGAVVGGIDRWLRSAISQYRARHAIHPDDPAQVLLEKLLNASPPRNRPLTTVRLKGGVEYYGSLGARTEQGTVLVGWFSIPLNSFPGKLTRAVKAYKEKNRLADIMELARRNKVEIELRNAIYDKDGQSEGHETMHWGKENKEVLDVTTKWEPEGAQEEPLTLV